ncbi:MnmC family methyltransferase, partial [Acidovorax sp. SRB_24]|uniref:MnmC family methyltransferase n=1 Tax=Acidovorax sp. SRB_24 TaxID=1962700 RepID=UPI00353054EA
MAPRIDAMDSSPALAPTAFLHGCDLPAAWAGEPQWRILQTDFGGGQDFLAAWAAWRADPARPTLLHFVALQDAPLPAAEERLRAAAAEPALAQELQAQCWGLLPGVHRLAFEGGRVLLTLCLGEASALLRQQDWTVDAVYLGGPGPWGPHFVKALARCCRRGTHLAAA